MPATYKHAHHHGCRPRHMSITICEVVNKGSHPTRTWLTEGQLEEAANNFRRSKHTSSTISSVSTAKFMRFDKDFNNVRPTSMQTKATLPELYSGYLSLSPTTRYFRGVGTGAKQRLHRNYCEIFSQRTRVQRHNQPRPCRRGPEPKETEAI